MTIAGAASNERSSPPDWRRGKRQRGGARLIVVSPSPWP